jgi:predicted AAA+ superfamily ATPase
MKQLVNIALNASSPKFIICATINVLLITKIDEQAPRRHKKINSPLSFSSFMNFFGFAETITAQMKATAFGKSENDCVCPLKYKVENASSKA